jgi:hypothetical protein
MGRHRGNVERPIKRTEYTIRFASRDAEKGWRDLVSTARSAAVDAWDFLTRTPHEHTESCYPLRGDLGTVTIEGVDRVRWQYKPTRASRIWYAVEPPEDLKRGAGVVLLERVTTGHPNETLKNHR